MFGCLPQACLGCEVPCKVRICCPFQNETGSYTGQVSRYPNSDARGAALFVYPPNGAFQPGVQVLIAKTCLQDRNLHQNRQKFARNLRHRSITSALLKRNTY